MAIAVAVRVWKPVLAVPASLVPCESDWLVACVRCADVGATLAELGATPLDGFVGGYGVGAALASAGTLSRAAPINTSMATNVAVRPRTAERVDMAHFPPISCAQYPR